MTDDADALRWRVDRLQREVAALRTLVLQFYRRRENSDSRLPGVLAMIYRFELAKPWFASELLEESRQADRDLWLALDRIVGDRGDPVIRLGLWLQRHVDVEADGLILTRVRKNCGAWLYAVQPVE